MKFLQWMDKGWKEKWLRVYVNHVNVCAMHCLVVYTKSWRTKLPNEWQPNACLKVLNRWIACVNKFSKLKFMSRTDIKLIKTKRHRFDPSVCVFINPFCREWANGDKTEIKIQNTSSAISHFSFALGRHTIVLSEFHYLLIFLRFYFDVLCDFSLCGALLYPAHTTWTVVVTTFTLYTLLSYTELDCRNAHRDIGAMYINKIYNTNILSPFTNFDSIWWSLWWIHRIREVNWLETENDIKSIKESMALQLFRSNGQYCVMENRCDSMSDGHRAKSPYNKTLVSCA